MGRYAVWGMNIKGSQYLYGYQYANTLAELEYEKEQCKKREIEYHKELKEIKIKKFKLTNIEFIFILLISLGIVYWIVV